MQMETSLKRLFGTVFRALSAPVMAAALLTAGCGEGGLAGLGEEGAQARDPKLAPGTLEWAVSGAWRTGAQIARDEWRHPAETLEFFGIENDDLVVELFPGGGWYTEILGPFLKRGGGGLVAVLPDPASSDYNRQAEEAYRAAYADRPETYGAISITELTPEADSFTADGTADAVLTFRNVHNWMAEGYADRMFDNAFRALKPGGVLGVVEHRLPSAWDQDLSARTGYVHEAYVIQLAQAAGFELEAESEINANLNDPANHLLGVWMLPPRLLAPEAESTLAAGYDRQHYIDIGESDRMTLRFRKPLGPAEPAPAEPAEND